VRSGKIEAQTAPVQGSKRSADLPPSAVALLRRTGSPPLRGGGMNSALLPAGREPSRFAAGRRIPGSPFKNVFSCRSRAVLRPSSVAVLLRPSSAVALLRRMERMDSSTAEGGGNEAHI